MAATAKPNNDAPAFNIQFVVEQINQVLSKAYSLVEFDQLQPQQHLQLLSDVFASLSPQAAVDFSKDVFEEAIATTQDFLLKTLNYRIPAIVSETFASSFAQGERTILFPIFQWVLSRMPDNHLRVYLARFLQRIDVPEDLKMSDDGLRDLYARYEQLRGEFIGQHKRVEQMKAANADPAEARRKISAMESDRDKLQSSIAAAQKKLSTVPNKDVLISACNALRTEQDDQAKLQEKYEEQQAALETAGRRSTELNHRLRDIRRDVTENRIDSIMRRMSDEIKANRIALDQQIPMELNEKRAQSAALQKLLTEPLDMPALQSEQAQLDREITTLRSKVAERNRPTDDGTDIVAMKAQVKRVVDKKNELLAELHVQHGELERLSGQQREQETQLDQLRNSRVLKGDDFKRYSNQVRSKTAAAKTMKQRLADLRGEFGVLQYTERLLRSKHDDMREEISQLEARFGAKGFFETAENLSRVSEQKNSMEQVKGRTLEELSVVVQGLVAKIQERRQKLAPLVNDMRAMRSQAQVMDQDYEEKKSQFEYQQSLMLQEVSKLEAEVGALLDETKLNETIYHRLNAQILMVQVQLKRVESEMEFRSGAKQLDLASKSYAHFFHSATDTLEMRSKELQKRRRELDETHENNLQQVESFAGLRKLLDGKLSSMRKEGGGSVVGVGAGSGGRSLDQDIQAMIGGSTTRNGVDMLVLGHN